MLIVWMLAGYAVYRIIFDAIRRHKVRGLVDRLDKAASQDEAIKIIREFYSKEIG